MSSLLLITDKRLEGKHKRQLFTSKGYSTTRLEVSFYGDELKKPELYEHIIKQLLPKGKNNLNNNKKYITDYPCFS